MSDQRYSIEKLTADNYEPFSKAARAVIDGKGWTRIINGTASTTEFGSPSDYETAVRQCRAFLVSSISYDQMHLVDDTASPRDIWLTLKEHFRSAGVNTTFHLMAKFFSMMMRTQEAGKDYTARVDALVRQLREHGVELSDAIHCFKLVHGLDERYEVFRKTLDSLGEKNMKQPEFVRRRIHNDDVKFGETSDDDTEATEQRAMAARSHFKNGGAVPLRRPATRPTRSADSGNCYRCGFPGHTAAICKVRLEDDYYVDANGNRLPDEPGQAKGVVAEELEYSY